jgi:phage terminase Nu1 subunit (DNA packaging protein)
MIDDQFSPLSTQAVDNFVENSVRLPAEPDKTRLSAFRTRAAAAWQALMNQ